MQIRLMSRTSALVDNLVLERLWNFQYILVRIQRRFPSVQIDGRQTSLKAEAGSDLPARHTTHHPLRNSSDVERFVRNVVVNGFGVGQVVTTGHAVDGQFVKGQIGTDEADLVPFAVVDRSHGEVLHDPRSASNIEHISYVTFVQFDRHEVLSVVRSIIEQQSARLNRLYLKYIYICKRGMLIQCCGI